MDDQKKEIDGKKTAWAWFVGLGIGVLLAIKIYIFLKSWSNEIVYSSRNMEYIIRDDA